MDYKVVEKFVSINGEGNRAGYLSVFIRFKGCNLACSYCDTKWANVDSCDYELLSADDIYDYIKGTHINCITLTGGEPLIQPGINELLLKLSQDPNISVEIETNGSVDIRPFRNFKNPPVFTVDYKLASSGMQDKMDEEQYRYLTKRDSVKFVIGSEADLIATKKFINKFNLTDICTVHLSVVFGSITMAEIVEFMKQHQMNSVKLQPQLHKFIWEPMMRGV